MAWTVRFTPRADKDLAKLGSADRARVIRFLDERIRPLDDPRTLGKALQVGFAGVWRYRVGDICIVVRIEYGEVIILVLTIGNRGDIYR